ncbi:MAG: gamma-glutamyltransferase [Marinospirillum sp.]|uniref:gamma-glutamyltransferase n=1 Tax=Marinospirillum sp. TaxID=2183934 RepID=UPI0019F7A4B9|nr:gamma-glutamyltransferase [Marinospirillum sp.]MBE0505603.1 gamma-glutamyltransferase [Marinospirillum sp.]
MPFATRLVLLPLAAALLLLGCKPAPEAGKMDNQKVLPVEALQPEVASGLQQRPGWQFEHQAVAAANPLAAEAGHKMLVAGGNAVDAAIAAQLVLNLVEPQSSGIGGGGFLLSWDGDQLIAWDGRETAPAAATPTLFLDAGGQPLPFMEAVTSGRAVGVPGLLKMLEAAHQQQGHLPWQQLFEPAIQLAEKGFEVSPRLHQLLVNDPALSNNPAARNYFYLPDGSPLPVGHLLKNPAMALILRQVAEQGSDAFYTGILAQTISKTVQQQGGLLTPEDLQTYQPVAREAFCGGWLDYLVCGFPPPSSGQIALMQMLGILEQLSSVQNSPESQSEESFYTPEGMHQYIEASKRAFADRALYLADPDFVTAPAGDWMSLIDPEYLLKRAQEIQPVSQGVASPGQPGGLESAYASQWPQPEYGTTHISVMDAEGRGVAMTTSIEQAFGARILTDGGTGLPGGFLLNNQLTDFSFLPADSQGKPVANRVEPGKRPRSSMSPTLVFDPQSRELVASLGSPGGAAIIHFTTKTLLGSLGWKLAPQQAIELPNLANFNSRVTLLEKGGFSDHVKHSLEARGHELREQDLTSGIQMLLLTPQGILGGADPRREGWVVGE